MAGKKQQNDQPIVSVADSRVAIQVQGSQIMPFSCTHPTAQSRGVVVQPLTGVQRGNAREVKFILCMYASTSTEAL